jgi:2-keto-4-pentenoate hydratase/2-oxohepta-3-ene-1,7-dioic acid hydratase in catechol pathway
MKLIRFGEPGAEKPGVLLEHGTRIDVSGFGRDYDEEFFGGGELASLVQWLEANNEALPRVDSSVRLGPPICRPSKIICIGLNYRDHAEETGMELPQEPAIFFKATSSIVGANDPVVIPRDASKVDWEVELALVIGKKAKYLDERDALGHVAGYLLHNDYSEREFQLERGGQWVKGKSADTFAPLGPFLATRDEIVDPGNLHLWLRVNGKTMQDGHTSNMTFGVSFLVSYLSRFMTLLPGDVVSTGTPAGVGLGLDPPVYLKPGDVVELGIDGLGQARQEVVK